MHDSVSPSLAPLPLPLSLSLSLSRVGRMARLQLQTMLSCSVFLFLIHFIAPTLSASLKVGFYQRTCPNAETIVKETVARAAARNPEIAAGLIRMHFHDCFVRGCDASVLLDPTPGNRVEKQSPANFPSLRGFEVIDEAKAILESYCPRTVSCTDILAFAARDAACVTGGIEYQVPGGRRDGRISRESEIRGNLPAPSSTVEQLRDNFALKGLSVDDMVTLSGAHSIGISHCRSFSGRLYKFNSTHPQDPSMDPAFANYLKARCPPPSGDGGDPTAPLDVATPKHLDNRYYRNLKEKKGVLTTDQLLENSPLTANLVLRHAKKPYEWSAKFAAAMVKMGSIEVLTGKHGEIRENCKVINNF